MWMSSFWWKQCNPYLKNIDYMLVHIEIYGGNINVYIMHINYIYYYFSKRDQNYKFYKMVIVN